jgi:hypothetical protein
MRLRDQTLESCRIWSLFSFPFLVSNPPNRMLIKSVLESDSCSVVIPVSGR